MKQMQFVLDLNRCTGCQACQLACEIENGLAADASWRRVHTFNAMHLPGVPHYHLSLACNHCAEPPCLRYCPALAYRKDPRTGAVLLNADKCIGCRYCSWVCPFDAPKFQAGAGIMQKCTFCAPRLHDGLAPACVQACPTGALQHEEAVPGNGTAPLPGFPQTRIGPAMRFIPLQENQHLPEMAAAAGDMDFAEVLPAPVSKITLRSEWTLAVFTLLAALLVGWFSAALLGAAAANPYVFAGLGLLGMLLSTHHLGKPLQAYRAILNWRHSWLSREILFFSGFMGSAVAVLVVFPGNTGLQFVALVLGFAALSAMDQVYRVVAAVEPRRLHSAQVWWSGLLFAGVFSGKLWLVLPVGLWKFFLYLKRKQEFAERGQAQRHWLNHLRLLGGLGLPILLLTIDPVTNLLPALLAAIAGEAIDRGEFYEELDIITPERQVQRDLHLQQ